MLLKRGFLCRGKFWFFHHGGAERTEGGGRGEKGCDEQDGDGMVVGSQAVRSVRQLSSKPVTLLAAGRSCVLIIGPSNA